MIIAVKLTNIDALLNYQNQKRQEKTGNSESKHSGKCRMHSPLTSMEKQLHRITGLPEKKKSGAGRFFSSRFPAGYSSGLLSFLGETGFLDVLRLDIP